MTAQPNIADKLVELAGKCEAATKPSLVLDKAIKRTLTGKPVGRWDHVPRYTSNPDSAYQLLPLSFAGMVTVRHSRAALDICVVALKAHARESRKAAELARGEAA